ncbi:cyclic pyranopterin monophosphate synthase MoaC [archaeon]|nr:MAG: cyclic pyranopterin monophosphate synthase MoaC [archaeon]
MVDISNKPQSLREAVAEGKIRLKRSTIELIKKGLVEKGDVRTVTEIVGLLAAKRTPLLLPLCHPIPITNVSIDMKIDENESCIVITARVKTIAQTGVEMEALTATVLALLNIWDMVKKYEKDERGEYPSTLIYDVRVISKKKITLKRA